MSLISDAPVLDELRDIGYEIVTSPSHASHVTLWTADRMLPSAGLSDFEFRLLHDSEVDRVLSWVAPTFMWDASRNRVVKQFDQLREIADQQVDHPRLVFSHIISPHPPFTFEADGSDAPPVACYPLECEAGFVPPEAMSTEDYAARYVSQVEHVNRLTLSALDALLQDPDAVIVLMSDHGLRNDLQDHQEWYRTLFATRTPDYPGAFDAAPNPTALFATLARTYFSADAELPRTTRYAMVDDMLLRLRPLD
jgi:hypothetical protein